MYSFLTIYQTYTLFVPLFVCLFGCKYLKLKNSLQLHARPGDPETEWFRISHSLGPILGSKCPLLKHLTPMDEKDQRYNRNSPLPGWCGVPSRLTMVATLERDSQEAWADSQVRCE